MPTLRRLGAAEPPLSFADVMGSGELTGASAFMAHPENIVAASAAHRRRIPNLFFIFNTEYIPFIMLKADIFI
jgi:hypothetical protein